MIVDIKPFGIGHEQLDVFNEGRFREDKVNWREIEV